MNTTAIDDFIKLISRAFDYQDVDVETQICDGALLLTESLFALDYDLGRFSASQLKSYLYEVILMRRVQGGESLPFKIAHNAELKEALAAVERQSADSSFLAMAKERSASKYRYVATIEALHKACVITDLQHADWLRKNKATQSLVNAAFRGDSERECVYALFAEMGNAYNAAHICLMDEKIRNFFESSLLMLVADRAPKRRIG